VVFPVEGFAEIEGTVTNIEGRVQKVNRLVPGPGQTRPAWSVLDDLAQRMGGELGAPSAATLAKEIERVAPAYHGVTWDFLDWGEGREGVVLPIDTGVQRLEYIPVDPNLKARTAKYAVHLGRVMYDDGVRVRMSPSLAALAPPAVVYLNPEDAGELRLEAGDVASIEGENGSVELPVALDRSLGRGTVYVPANLAATAELGASVAVVITAGEKP
jgi:predicted molibdopterin-dependent oxidoreductase YjgC